MTKRQNRGSKRTNRSQAGATESRAASQTGVSQSADAKTLHQAVSFALSFAEWAVNPPTPPQTMARSMNSILIEVCVRNAKILACFYMQQALNAMNDYITMHGGDIPDQLEGLIKQRDALKASMESYGCGRLY
jgi:hypothetical protein